MIAQGFPLPSGTGSVGFNLAVRSADLPLDAGARGLVGAAVYVEALFIVELV
jgi:hypothetical protein